MSNWNNAANLPLLHIIKKVTMEFFLNGAQPSLNSGNLINHLNMNWNQFKDPVFRLCLAGAVVASWSPTQELAGSTLLL